MSHEYPFVLGDEWEKSSQPLAVTNPYDDSRVATTGLAGEADVERATQAAVAAAPAMRQLAAYLRAEILVEASAVLTRRKEDVVRSLSGNDVG